MKQTFVPMAVLVVALAVPAGFILHANNGQFVYTLDDPYIHLALAENIAGGHYGINSSEFAAPSSSVVWPFLLVPFSALPYAYLLPVFFNAVFSLLTVVLLSRFYGQGGMLLSVVSVFAFNLTGLVYTGMEHSLQLLAVAAVVSGLKDFTEKHRISKLLAVSLVAAPLIRYECLAVSLPVLVFLFVSGERKKSVALFSVIAVLLGTFSLFLLGLGLDPLPASVAAKSAVVGDSGSISSILGNLSDSVRSFRGLVQLLVLVPLVSVFAGKNRNSGEKLLAGTVIVAVMLHMMVGRSGWFHRYGVYMWAFSILVCFHLYRDVVRRHSLVFSVVLLALSADYLSGYTKIPAASGNIYQQQYQMRRFVHNWLREPVAVNDLGLVSMGYDSYVLDLWGLATPSALTGAGDPAWVDSAASLNGVNTAIVYSDEIAGVQHWTSVARMQISPPLVVCVSGGVDFLSAPWSSADSLREKLVEFEKTLPEEIELVIFQ
ncbi:hypothetical protein DRQ21_05545 [Candidatus Fermentibacteria bacterium]|nr:MAG: hypothetical protein DRQ21_05545 [Candidatus Fermentibacteria bacterium]